VTVLRDGRMIGSRQTSEVTKEDLARMMVGREVLLERKRPSKEGAFEEAKEVVAGAIRLKLENVNAVNAQDVPVLRNISLDVSSGEIVGVAGVSGNGQKSLAEVVAGLLHPAGGRVYLHNKDVTGLPPSKIIEEGVSYIPEERMHDGTIKDFTVAENLILQDHIHSPYSNGFFLNFKQIAQHANAMISSFNIKTPSKETPVKNLSGGNIQKLILARELARKPQVLIAAQPTRGVDIGAMEYIHNQLLQQRAEGLATLLISEDLDEIRALSDRIVVMFGGEIMGIVDNDTTTVEELGLMMAGEKRVFPESTEG
jgi:simple sugar transport system ATP-binding protein